MEKLFSYGTLRSKEIQRQIFNRVLTGTADQVLGYKLKSLKIEEEFGMADYVVVIPSENPADVIHGVVFNVSASDLAKVDLFESNAYRRVQVTLHSGDIAWIYIEN
ncbi:gamma-glutamylcyclotransferase family protein [Flavobacterium branchiicola]|uniref:Gamma-glutamylcyclotransferase family protein n=1 Tax=Flavobacterium branchiicola TaxID=1114875 RepID=A0ABV9PCL8_9FLAO|nr:gamma-glutamylcyclotransferase family protein [Flavobacterium branchiicola]MBS7254496.1 gamma-glutamylcyclotransferase [Flavobacterium branchiicola]